MQTEDTHREIFPVWEGLKFAGFQQIWRSGEGEAWQMAAEWDREGRLECEGMRPDYEAAREYINAYLPLVPEKEAEKKREWQDKNDRWDDVCAKVKTGEITREDSYRLYKEIFETE